VDLVLCFRSLSVVSLAFTVVAASAVRAQQSAAGAPSKRTVTFTFDQKLETDVAELYVAPGSSTTVHMPEPIRKDGYTIKGGEGRVTAIQAPGNPNILVLLATGQIGSEPISLLVTTVDGKRYPFRVASIPGRMDSEVRVVSWRAREKGQLPAVGPSIMDVLLQGKEIAVRSFEKSRVADPYSPWVEKAVRQDDWVYLRVYRERRAKD
jgi:hypothetical protein